MGGRERRASRTLGSEQLVYARARAAPALEESTSYSKHRGPGVQLEVSEKLPQGSLDGSRLDTSGVEMLRWTGMQFTHPGPTQ